MLNHQRWRGMRRGRRATIFATPHSPRWA
jgi:hypothetical protein